MLTAGNKGDGFATEEKVVGILRMQANGFRAEGLQQKNKQGQEASYGLHV
jgi:hypothetical protein